MIQTIWASLQQTIRGGDPPDDDSEVGDADVDATDAGNERPNDETADDINTNERSRSSSDSDVTVSYDQPTLSLDDISSIHQSVVTPSSIDEHANAVRTGEQWTKTMWITEFPDAPADGLYETLYSAPETRTTDISIHLEPRDTRATLKSLENQLEDLEANYEYLN